MSTKRNRVPRVRRGLWIGALLLVAAALAAGSARADLCGNCAAPTLDQLNAQPEFELGGRGTWKDYYETDAGDCDVAMEGEPEIRKLRSWLVLRGAGEVWNCPHSSSTDNVTVSVSESDSESWTVTTEIGASGKVLGVGLSARIALSLNESHGVTRVTSVSKSLKANWCRRIRWEALFEVADYEATVLCSVTRRYAWWIKNPATGPTVLAKGDIWVSCGQESLTFAARGPISGHFHLKQNPCADLECQTVPARDLGFFPPLSGEAYPLDEPVEEDGEEPMPDEGGPVVPAGEGVDEGEDEGEDEELPSSGELPEPPAGEPASEEEASSSEAVTP